MEAIVQLVLFVSEPAVLLRHQVDIGIFFPLAVTIVFRHFLEDYALVLDLRVDTGRHFLQFIVNHLPDVLLNVIEHVVETALDFLHHLVHLFFLVVPASEGRAPEDVHVALDLVVDVVVGADGLLEVLVAHLLVVGLDNPDHVCADGVELEVILQLVGVRLVLQQAVYHAPQQQRHLLLHEVLHHFRDLEVQLQKSHPQLLVRLLRPAEGLQQFGVFVL